MADEVRVRRVRRVVKRGDRILMADKNQHNLELVKGVAVEKERS
jgi:hypothetical protein